MVPTGIEPQRKTFLHLSFFRKHSFLQSLAGLSKRLLITTVIIGAYDDLHQMACLFFFLLRSYEYCVSFFLLFLNINCPFLPFFFRF